MTQKEIKELALALMDALLEAMEQKGWAIIYNRNNLGDKVGKKKGGKRC